MDENTKVKKLGQAYDLLNDCGEVYLKSELEDMMKARGYELAVSRDKYAFKRR